MPDLIFVYGLLSQGVAFGAGLGAIVWITGFTIASIYKILRRS